MSTSCILSKHVIALNHINLNFAFYTKLTWRVGVEEVHGGTSDGIEHLVV